MVAMRMLKTIMIIAFKIETLQPCSKVVLGLQRGLLLRILVRAVVHAVQVSDEVPPLNFRLLITVDDYVSS